jgi:hypothetical protein
MSPDTTSPTVPSPPATRIRATPRAAASAARPIASPGPAVVATESGPQWTSARATRPSARRPAEPRPLAGFKISSVSDFTRRRYRTRPSPKLPGDSGSAMRLEGISSRHALLARPTRSRRHPRRDPARGRSLAAHAARHRDQRRGAPRADPGHGSLRAPALRLHRGGAGAALAALADRADRGGALLRDRPRLARRRRRAHDLRRLPVPARAARRTRGDRGGAWGRRAGRCSRSRPDGAAR